MPSVRTLLAGVVVAVMAIGLVTAVTLSYLASERVLIGYAEQLTERVATDTTRFTENFLDPADDAAALTQRLAESAVIRTDDPALLARYFFQIIQTRPDFAGIFYGGADGEFIFVSRDDTVTGASYRLKEIATRPERRVELTFLDERFAPVFERLDPADTYDPRTRPWYEAASERGSVAWTDPYIFFTSKRPGITVATPVFGADEATVRGAVGIDIRIDALSRFLNQLEVGERGAAAIVAPDGKVVAHRNPSLVLSYSGDGEPPRFTTVDEVDDPGLQGAVAGLLADDGAALTGLEPERTRIIRFYASGEWWRGAVRRLRGEQTPWAVVTYLPETDILGPSKTARNVGYAISALVTLLSALAVIYFAQAFSRPVRALEEQANMISRGDFDDVDLPPARARELEATRMAFKRATHWLRNYRRENDELTARLRRSAEELETKVEERTSELRRANDRLRAAEGRARSLASELNHRMKNVFALTSALVSVAARGASSPGEVRDGATARIHALALAHSATQSDGPTELGSLVRAVTEPFVQREGIDVTISGEPVVIQSSLVSTLGLVLYELSTNAVKYGALRDGGSLAITWSLTPQRGLRFEWSERRGRADDGRVAALSAGKAKASPLTDDRADHQEDEVTGALAHRGGRGSVLFDTMLNQLSASATREIGEDGIDITITIPGPVEATTAMAAE